MENFFDLILFVVLILLGFIVGTLLEKRHYRSIIQRESELLSLPTISLKTPLNADNIVHVRLVTGCVVISIDYFKKIVASLRNFFGGNVASYETLIDRARREAILRLKESAKDADEIINVKIETSSISKNAQNSIGAVEVLAYGTAIYRKRA
ncbi:MAG: heavy metal-binding domain-containing protein [Campylobacterales bacterium]|nr:heavy metal-binding domain-containing protein [Campylobacterales bacterium]